MKVSQNDGYLLGVPVLRTIVQQIGIYIGVPLFGNLVKLLPY